MNTISPQALAALNPELFAFLKAGGRPPAIGLLPSHVNAFLGIEPPKNEQPGRRGFLIDGPHPAKGTRTTRPAPNQTPKHDMAEVDATWARIRAARAAEGKTVQPGHTRDDDVYTAIFGNGSKATVQAKTVKTEPTDDDVYAALFGGNAKSPDDDENDIYAFFYKPGA